MVRRRASGISGGVQAADFARGFINVVIASLVIRLQEMGVFYVVMSRLGFFPCFVFREFGDGQYLMRAAIVGRERFRGVVTVTSISSSLSALLLFVTYRAVCVSRWRFPTALGHAYAV